MFRQLHIDDTDNMLLLALNKSDVEAFTIIYERYNKMLYVIAYKYLKESFGAEDIVQQAFLKLWETRSFLDPTMNLRNYLYTMVKNMVLNEIRNNTTAMEKNYELVQNSPEFEDELMTLLEKKELRRRFIQITNELPVQEGRVCRLKLLEEYSNQEVAEVLGISLATVKTHYSLGMKVIRTKMQRYVLLLLLLMLSN